VASRAHRKHSSAKARYSAAVDIARSSCRTGGSATELSATDAWGATPLPVMGTTLRLNHINSESFNLGQRVRQTGAPHSSCCRQPSRCSANLTINSQSAANFSHASLSNGLKAFSARWRHSSAICRYFSASLTQIKPRTDAIYVKSRGARSFLKTGQCYFQNQPLGSETGQYPRGLPAAGA